MVKAQPVVETTTLPKLPVPTLEETCRRYLNALKELQDPAEHEATIKAVDEFLHGDGPRIQQRLLQWAETQARYVMVALRSCAAANFYF